MHTAQKGTVENWGGKMDKWGVQRIGEGGYISRECRELVRED